MSRGAIIAISVLATLLVVGGVVAVLWAVSRRSTVYASDGTTPLVVAE